jgi:hypothetical protein
MGLALVLLQGTNRDGACFATFDHSDIRGSENIALWHFFFCIYLYKVVLKGKINQAA